VPYFNSSIRDPCRSCESRNCWYCFGRTYSLLRRVLNQDRFLRFARFCAVGGFVTGLDLLSVALLSQWLTPFAAVSLSYLIAVSCHFSLNKFWVFRCSREDYLRQIIQYLLAALLTWLTTVCVVNLALGSITSSVLIAKILALPPATLVGFLALRLFVFAPPRRSKTRKEPPVIAR
jgi:putative flippase GtrA